MADRQVNLVCPQYDNDGVLRLITITLNRNLDGSVALNDNSEKMRSLAPSSLFDFGPLLNMPVMLAEVLVANTPGGENRSGNSSQSNNSNATTGSNGNRNQTSGTSGTTAGASGAGTIPTNNFAAPLSTPQVTTLLQVGGTPSVDVPVAMFSSARAVSGAGPLSDDPPAAGPGSLLDVLAVPEPGTWMLTALALGAIAYRRRRSA